MRPEQIPHLNFVRDLFGNLWLDVRDSGYLPVLGAETNHDKSTLALIFNPKTFTEPFSSSDGLSDTVALKDGDGLAQVAGLGRAAA